MFIWLASYPKSGNTLVRAMISSYFFSSDGNFNFEMLNNIKQFPDYNLFNKFKINLSDEKEVVKNYIKTQEKISLKNKIQFLKTHSSLFNINGCQFTDLKHTIGVIYIVRDPRNVAYSWATHADKTIDYSVDRMINNHHFGGDLKSKNNSDKIFTYCGNWGFNYNSWKSFNFQSRYLLVKYEDLIENKENIFKNILKFIQKLNNQKIEIDQNKISNILKSTSFNSMKKLETDHGFNESKTKTISNKKIPFFNLGPKNDWKKILSDENREKIEKAFKEEMLELGYL